MLPLQPVDLRLLLYSLLLHKLNDEHILKLQLFEHILKQLHKLVLAIDRTSPLQLHRNARPTYPLHIDPLDVLIHVAQSQLDQRLGRINRVVFGLALAQTFQSVVVPL